MWCQIQAYKVLDSSWANTASAGKKRAHTCARLKGKNIACARAGAPLAWFVGAAGAGPSRMGCRAAGLSAHPAPKELQKGNHRLLLPFPVLCWGIKAAAETHIPWYHRELQDLRPAAAAPAHGQLREGMRGPRCSTRTPPNPPAWGCAVCPVGPAHRPQPTRPGPFATRRARGSGAAPVMGSEGDGEEAPWTNTNLEKGKFGEAVVCLAMA